MNAVFDLLAEQRILEALRNGDFDHLPGAGRPLVIEDEPFVSPEQRMANHILRNAGFAPPEIGLRRAMGARRGDVMAQFLTEAVLLSLLGGLIGFGVGVLGSQLIGQVIEDLRGLVQVTPNVAMIALGVAVGLSRRSRNQG